MYIKDLSESQAIQMVRIATIEDWIQEDKGFKASYYPYNPEHWSDAYEAYTVRFYSITFADTVDELVFTIFNNRDVTLAYIRPNEHGVKCQHDLPVRNQYKLFEYMQSIGLEGNNICTKCYTQIPSYIDFCNNCAASIMRSGMAMT